MEFGRMRLASDTGAGRNADDMLKRGVIKG